MNKEETIIFLEKEIAMYERLIKKRKRNIKNTPPNVSDLWLEDYKETLSKLKKELKELKEKDD
jgi:hypothetical protein